MTETVVRQRPAAATEARQTHAQVRELSRRYASIRDFSERLCEPLETEDYVIQSMPDVSPAKWHLAHTTWFFETFLLESLPNYRPFNQEYRWLFNSYYNAVGEQFPRLRRGLLSRPTVEDTYAYRRYVDDHMLALLELPLPDARVAELVTIGLHHEQQHQELIVTDIKHVFCCNPLRPVYRPREARPTEGLAPQSWKPFDQGVYEIGAEGVEFSYDNEGPRHKVYLQPFSLSTRLVTNAQFLEFMNDGGYSRPELWLSEGWAVKQERGWTRPLYWEHTGRYWYAMSLHGFAPLDASEPVCHVSYYEADAFARWARARLPREAEWEVASRECPVEGNFVECETFHPAPGGLGNGPGLTQMFGDVWEWTASAYSPYPGYQAPEGALGEYNGKFMCNQFVLRGGSCATSVTHIRPTYRNFFPADARWQFLGIRLARDET